MTGQDIKEHIGEGNGTEETGQGELMMEQVRKKGGYAGR